MEDVRRSGHRKIGSSELALSAMFLVDFRSPDPDQCHQSRSAGSMVSFCFSAYSAFVSGKKSFSVAFLFLGALCGQLLFWLFPITRSPDQQITRSFTQRCFTSSSESTCALTARLCAPTMSPSFTAW